MAPSGIVVWRTFKGSATGIEIIQQANLFFSSAYFPACSTIVNLLLVSTMQEDLVSRALATSSPLPIIVTRTSRLWAVTPRASVTSSLGMRASQRVISLIGDVPDRFSGLYLCGTFREDDDVVLPICAAAPLGEHDSGI